MTACVPRLVRDPEVSKPRIAPLAIVSRALRCDVCRRKPAIHEDHDRPALVCGPCRQRHSDDPFKGER